MIRPLALLALGLVVLSGCTSPAAVKPETAKSAEGPKPAAAAVEALPAGPTIPTPAPEIKIPPPRIALVLGGGAAKGFAHIGVIKALEAQGFHPDIVVGTSAGSVVGVLYAGGFDGFELQRLSLDLSEAMFSDWSLPDRGFLKGEALQDFINKSLKNRTLDKLNRTVAVIATDLQSGESVAFQRGDSGLAVRASSTVPGVFQPVRIGAHEYVDGGLVSPVPVRVARRMGADFVIASDISAKPSSKRVEGTLDVLLQTFTIMGNAIASQELTEADLVIKPDISKLNATDFQSRHLAILEGERAAQAAIPLLRQKLADREARLRAGLTQPAAATPSAAPAPLGR